MSALWCRLFRSKSRSGSREMNPMLRCKVAVERVKRLPLCKITDSCKRTLLRLLNSEITFLTRISPISSPPSCNIGHIEAVVHILEQPYITGVSRVCKPVPISATCENRENNVIQSKDAHVDIVCTLNKAPVWFIVSDRNPRYVPWDDSHGNRGLKTRIRQVLAAAKSSPIIEPSSIILFFASGIEKSVEDKLMREFGFFEFVLKAEDLHTDSIFTEELEGEWVNVHSRSYKNARILSIKVGQYEYASTLGHENADERYRVVGAEVTLNEKQLNLGFSFQSLISHLKDYFMDVESPRAGSLHEKDEFLNFDTTALVAIVSDISNGCAEELLSAPESLLQNRFKNNTEFVISQAMSELKNPIHPELYGLITAKRGIMCETVYSEFMELVSMYAGPDEKLRANLLVKYIRVVPDNPSTRMMSLPSTRKLDPKNKIVFGTGDSWGSPTLTANQGFVRAVSQTGMSLFTVGLRSRALVGLHNFEMN